MTSSPSSSTHWTYSYVSSPASIDTIISSSTGVPMAHLSSPTVTPVIYSTPYSPVSTSSIYLTPSVRKSNPDPEGDSYYISSLNLSCDNIIYRFTISFPSPVILFYISMLTFNFRVYISLWSRPIQVPSL